MTLPTIAAGRSRPRGHPASPTFSPRLLVGAALTVLLALALVL